MKVNAHAAIASRSDHTRLTHACRECVSSDRRALPIGRLVIKTNPAGSRDPEACQAISQRADRQEGCYIFCFAEHSNTFLRLQRTALATSRLRHGCCASPLDYSDLLPLPVDGYLSSRELRYRSNNEVPRSPFRAFGNWSCQRRRASPNRPVCNRAQRCGCGDSAICAHPG